MTYQIPQPDRGAAIRRILLRWLTTSLGIFAAVWLVPDIQFSGPGWQLGIVAAILGLLGALIRPFLVLLSLPVIFCTFGLFMLIIQALLLVLASTLASSLGIDFRVDGFWAAVLGGIVISLISTLLNVLAGDPGIRVYVRQNGPPPPQG